MDDGWTRVKLKIPKKEFATKIFNKNRMIDVRVFSQASNCGGRGRGGGGEIEINEKL